MTRCNTLSVKLTNSQLNKLKSAIKNGNEVTSNLSSSLIGNSNDETNFPHKLLSPDTQVSKLHKDFANGSSANIKFSKTQMFKMIQQEKSSRKRSIKKDISLAPNLAPKLAEKATEYHINKRINELNKKFTSSKGSGITLPNNETKDIMKVIKSLGNRAILLKGTTRKITRPEIKFLSFLKPLMTACLPLMKSVFTLSAKNATDAAIQNKKKQKKKIYSWIRNYSINNFE